MSTLTGHSAIDYAEARGLTLSKYADPVEDAREGLSVDEAREVAAEDPSLIYVEQIRTYRAAYWTDGDGEVVLTGPEHANLSDEELLTEARAEAARGDVDLSYGEIEIGDWTD